ncbi:MAG TPA: hypothetical protein PKN22_09555 [Taishania sp.]|nr:hypothetical protein [Taishania sp.]
MKLNDTAMEGVYTLELSQFDFAINKILIFDTFGNQIKNILNPQNQQTIDLSQHPNGIYHVSVIFDSEKAPIRLKIFKDSKTTS